MERHALDLLLVEAVGVVFWFNGTVPYLDRQLKVMHEYLADTISEGRKAQLGRVTITGNTKTPTATLLKLIPLRAGEDFNRVKLMETQRLLAQQGQFDPNKVGINPMPEMRPHEATDLVNIALLVMEKGT